MKSALYIKCIIAVAGFCILHQSERKARSSSRCTALSDPIRHRGALNGESGGVCFSLSSSSDTPGLVFSSLLLRRGELEEGNWFLRWWYPLVMKSHSSVLKRASCPCPCNPGAAVKHSFCFSFFLYLFIAESGKSRRIAFRGFSFTAKTNTRALR